MFEKIIMISGLKGDLSMYMMIYVWINNQDQFIQFPLQ
ncbi:hypothetical protein FM120_36480 [Sphingobacterium faecium PCAi_F2.5]|nr:hypothetical protein FM120_36480 [Sphingobacterium faecium PCAi_F2.5]